MYAVRMTNLDNPDGLFIQSYKSYDDAMDMCNALRNGLNTYDRSSVVDGRGIFRYADYSTRFIITGD